MASSLASPPPPAPDDLLLHLPPPPVHRQGHKDIPRQYLDSWRAVLRSCCRLPVPDADKLPMAQPTVVTFINRRLENGR